MTKLNVEIGSVIGLKEGHHLNVIIITCVQAIIWHICRSWNCIIMHDAKKFDLLDVSTEELSQEFKNVSLIKLNVELKSGVEIKEGYRLNTTIATHTIVWVIIWLVCRSCICLIIFDVQSDGWLFL